MVDEAAHIGALFGEVFDLVDQTVSSVDVDQALAQALARAAVDPPSRPNHWSAYLPTPPAPDCLATRMGEIADQLTPALQAELRRMGVPDAGRYRLGYDVSPLIPGT